MFIYTVEVQHFVTAAIGTLWATTTAAALSAGCPGLNHRFTDHYEQCRVTILIHSFVLIMDSGAGVLYSSLFQISFRAHHG